MFEDINEDDSFWDLCQDMSDTRTCIQSLEADLKRPLTFVGEAILAAKKDELIKRIEYIEELLEKRDKKRTAAKTSHN